MARRWTPPEKKLYAPLFPFICWSSFGDFLPFDSTATDDLTAPLLTIGKLLRPFFRVKGKF